MLPRDAGGFFCGVVTVPKTIWKFVLEVTDTQFVNMPAGSEILSVDNQDGSLCLWAMVNPVIDPTAEPERREIEIIGTGNPIDRDMVCRKFIGTVLAAPFVWHVFELNPL